MDVGGGTALTSSAVMDCLLVCGIKLYSQYIKRLEPHVCGRHVKMGKCTTDKDQGPFEWEERSLAVLSFTSYSRSTKLGTW